MSWTDDDLIGLRIKGSPSDRNRKGNVSRGAHPARSVEPDPRVVRNEPTPKPAKKHRYVDFPRICAAAGVPEPLAEHRFDPKRRWRFDFAWPDHKVALEVDGGVFANGRHTRGSGFVKDMEKLNAAAIAGWRVVRVTPNDVNTLGVSLAQQAIRAPRF
jgi:hypothetical protein